MNQPSQSSILLVDDDPSVLRLLRRLIEREGHACATAETGHQALALLEATTFDLLVLDKNLPDKDGIAVARDVRKMHPAMPILLITGYASEQSAREAAALRIADYILKPIEIDEFRSRLSELLRLSDGPPLPDPARLVGPADPRDTLTRSDRAEVLLIHADHKLRDTISEVLTICGCNVTGRRSTVEAALASGGAFEILIADLDQLQTREQWLPPEACQSVLATIAIARDTANAAQLAAPGAGVDGVFAPPYHKPKLAFEFERVMMQTSEGRHRRRKS